MVTQTFGDMLYYPEAELKEFPPPEELKFRVIISTKPPKEYLEAKGTKESSHLEKKDAEDDIWGNENDPLDAQQDDNKVCWAFRITLTHNQLFISS